MTRPRLRTSSDSVLKSFADTGLRMGLNDLSFAYPDDSSAIGSASSEATHDFPISPCSLANAVYDGEHLVPSCRKHEDDDSLHGGGLISACATLSGASGERLRQELSAWHKQKHFRGEREEAKHDQGDPRNVWERAELKVQRYWDRPVGQLFSFMYDCLQLSSGRDKVCAILQNYAKFASVVFSDPGSERYWMYRSIEDSISDGRKIFRFFKEFREVYKVRRGLHRMQEGIQSEGVASLPTACGCLDVIAHVSSFIFYLYDNLLWAASVGLVRSKQVPTYQRFVLWHGYRQDGLIISFLGGIEKIKRRKNTASYWRIVCAIVANALLLSRALSSRRGSKFEGADDPRLFHTIELIGMAANFRDLLGRLGYVPVHSESYIGLLGMTGAIMGLWSNYRKVVKDQCGSKQFVTVVERRVIQRQSETLAPCLQARPDSGT